MLCRIELDNIKYYLVVQAKNSAINFQKKNASSHDIEYIEEISLGDMDEDKTTFNCLIDDMRQYLTEYEINVILLHGVYEKSFVDIAKKYQKPVTTVKSAYHRAITKYRKARRDQC